MDTPEPATLPDDAGAALDELSSDERRRLATAVEQARTAKNWSVRHLAVASGLALGTISRIENAAANPRFDAIIRLALILELDLNRIVFGQKAVRQLRLAAGT